MKINMKKKQSFKIELIHDDLDKMYPQDPVVESHKSPIAELVDSLKTDEGYYIGWKANIAMAFFDEAKRKKAKISRKNI